MHHKILKTLHLPRFSLFIENRVTRHFGHLLKLFVIPIVIRVKSLDYLFYFKGSAAIL